jgi:hypothetical protein
MTPTEGPHAELLDPETAKALAELDALAHSLDTQWRIPLTNWRFGLDAVAGLVPGIGDAAAGLISLYLVLRAANHGASGGLIARMVGNVLLDTAVGSVPVAGTIFDVYFKANQRNIRLLRHHIATKRAPPSQR